MVSRVHRLPAPRETPSCASIAYERKLARILTVFATCGRQERHVLTFLTNAVRAHIAVLLTPSLISTMYTIADGET